MVEVGEEKGEAGGAGVGVGVAIEGGESAVAMDECQGIIGEGDGGEPFEGFGAGGAEEVFGAGGSLDEEGDSDGVAAFEGIGAFEDVACGENGAGGGLGLSFVAEAETHALRGVEGGLGEFGDGDDAVAVDEVDEGAFFEELAERAGWGGAKGEDEDEGDEGEAGHWGSIAQGGGGWSVDRFECLGGIACVGGVERDCIGGVWRRGGISFSRTRYWVSMGRRWNGNWRSMRRGWSRRICRA